MIQNEIAMLEKQAYDTKSKLLNASQFSELLGLQSEDEPEFIDEIIEMYTADARSMLVELKTLYSAKDKEIDLDPSGQIRGILCRMKREKSGTLTPVFQVGVMSRVRGKIVNTTVSITKHGRVEAWARAVDFYCEHKKIGKRSNVYKDLISRCPKPAQIKKFTA